MASEYGWKLQDILYMVFPEDFFLLQRQITLRKLDNYLMQNAIISNPHKEEKDQKDFIETILKQRRFMTGEEERPAEMDRQAVESFKKFLSKKSKMVKVRQV